ncbi:MAG: ATP-binding protein, partial [Desulfovibrionaceae bacterium]|nr:ATP-binding protein [Desulfovibrionaceae bacterium]
MRSQKVKPHPCGYHGDPRHVCACDASQVRRYRARISGPLLDRIDLQVEVPAVPYKDLKAPHGQLGSSDMRCRVLAAREIQDARYAALPLRTNADLSGRHLNSFCKLTEAEHAFLENGDPCAISETCCLSCLSRDFAPNGIQFRMIRSNFTRLHRSRTI